MRRFAALLMLPLVSCGSVLEPLCDGIPEADRRYYEETCAKADMIWLRGTHTCVKVTEYINLEPPKR